MIDFELIYDHPLSKTCELWERCDSHCCTMGRIFRPFDASTHLVNLPIPEPEYEFLRARSPTGVQWPEPSREIEIALDAYSLRLYMQPCNYGGACHGDLRPTVCRLYPFVPLIGDDLQIEALMNASALDLIWEAGAPDDPCLMRAPAERLRWLAGMSDLIGKLAARRANLEVLLWFNLTFRYLQAFQRYLAENLDEVEAQREGLDLEGRIQTLHACNRTQLFLGDPAFQAALNSEVERMARWASA